MNKNSIGFRIRSLVTVLALSFVALSASAKGVLYVKSGASGDGSSWNNAMGNIQQAVDSAAKSFTSPTPKAGKMAMVKNTIPNAPIHCVCERQNRMPCGRHSTSSRIEAPVVVKPEIVSK